MKTNKLTPNLAVKDIKQTARFYCENLGFELVMAVSITQEGIDQQMSDDKEYVYAMLKKDGVELMFQRADSFQEDISLAKSIPIGASALFTCREMASRRFTKN
ncbi:MAG: VOC family protein [Campylobacteraceae bacterium]|jgi:uncharacterized glyoxalase superfamily protein PhnB|nr:VOC family protein [Campylobacteraceae bacterium]